MSFNWLHLSDFHVGKDGYGQLQLFGEIISHVKEQKARGFIPDYIFITGDLANKGLYNEYKIFNDDFLEPLQKVIGGGIEERTFSVPGNHDVDRTKSPGFSRDKFLNNKNYYFDPTAIGLEWRKSIFERFSAYKDNDQTIQLGDWITSDSGAYSFIDAERSLGIVGINTAWLCEGEEDERYLSPGKPLVEKALSLIDECAVKIVLGHHPLSWLSPDHKKQIEALFGRYNVIYLHGHLHEAWAVPYSGAGRPFLAIQSGAAFQAREDTIYKNGFLWAKLSIEDATISLQPRNWNPNHQDWSLAEAFPEIYRKEDFWIFDLPSVKKKELTNNVVFSIDAPLGWSIKDGVSLLKYQATLEIGPALKYFDGSYPTWESVLSDSIPRREIVSHIANIIKNEEGPSVFILLGASCEGKSTAILQAAFQIVINSLEWRVLRRGLETNTIITDDIIRILSSNYRWVVLIDEAGNAIDSIIHIINQIPVNKRSNIHFLLASRDSDWNESFNRRIIENGCAIYQEKLSGLSLSDARVIVEGWEKYGGEGLGKLVHTSRDKRVDELISATKRNSLSKGSAFFGALLNVRYGDDLKEHTKKMLINLSEKRISSGRSLEDAIIYIASMDALGLDFLSRDVLAQALDCPSEELRRQVLQPLGEEAAATFTSDYVYTRHPLIASSVMNVALEDFAYDDEIIYIDLVNAALNLYQTKFVLDLGFWRYKIGDFFMDMGRKGLALSISNAVRAQEPHNAKVLTKLAHHYRRVLQPESAINVYNKYINNITSEADRRLYQDWSLSERTAKNYANAAYIYLFTISDQASSIVEPLEIEALFSAGIIFVNIYLETGEEAFKYISMFYLITSHSLIKDLDNKMSIESMAAEAQIDLITNAVKLNELIESFSESVYLLQQYVSSEVAKNYIKAYGDLTFEKYRRYFSIKFKSYLL